MSDAEIKEQMDLWVQNGTLPNGLLEGNLTKEFTSVGSQLFNKNDYATDYAYKIRVMPSTQYTWSVSALYKTYDINEVEVSSGTATTVTTGSNVAYIAFSGIDKDTFILNTGASVGTDLTYRESVMSLNGGAGYRLPNGTVDDVIYKVDKYVKNQRINKIAVVGVVAVNTTNYPLAKNGGQFINYLTAGGSEIGVIGTDSTSGDGTMYYELATPIETEIETEGLLLQYTVTTIYQDGDLALPYTVEFAMNTDQSVATLVTRDRLQQNEIDGHESRLDTVEPKVSTLETLTDNIVDGTQDIDFDNTISELTATTVKGAIDELASEAETNAGNISSLETNKEDKSNKVISWQATPTDTAYPSEKLVFDSTIMGVKKNGTLLTPNATRQVDVTTFKVSSQIASLSNNGTVSKSAISSYDYVLLAITNSSGKKRYTILHAVEYINFIEGYCSIPEYTNEVDCTNNLGIWSDDIPQGVTTAIQNTTDYSVSASTPIYAHLVQTSATVVTAYLPSGYTMRIFGVTL
jgi:hypothetical protein